MNRPVSTASDWESVRPLDIGRGVLGQQLEALRLISGALVEGVPFVMTVFTPLSIAAQMVQSRDAMLGYLLEHPAKVHRALEAITETFSEFSTECLSIGAAGLFFATTGWGTYDALTDEQYAEFGCPYDLRVLERVKEAEFNVLHVCGSNNMLLALADYPVAAVNWDAGDETNVWLKEGEKVTGKAAIGGISQIPDLSPEDVTREARWTLDTMDGTHWMLGPGCTVSPDMPEATLRALRNAFD